MAGFKVVIGELAEADLLAVPFPMRRSINQRIQKLQDEPRPDGWEQVGTGGHAAMSLHGYELLYTIDDAERSVTITAVLQA